MRNPPWCPKCGTSGVRPVSDGYVACECRKPVNCFDIDRDVRTQVYLNGEAMTIGEIVDALNEVNNDRAAARWMLPFLVNDRHNLKLALERWPWLEQMEPVE